jgi:hypothetical protein
MVLRQAKRISRRQSMIASSAIMLAFFTEGDSRFRRAREHFPIKRKMLSPCFGGQFYPIRLNLRFNLIGCCSSA